MRFHFDVYPLNASTNWKRTLREVSRSVIEMFHATCPLDLCGYGTEVVEPFYLEGTDPNAGVANVSISVVGSVVYAMQSAADTASVASALATALQSALSTKLGAVTVTHDYTDTETRWEDSGDPLIAGVGDLGAAVVGGVGKVVGSITGVADTILAKVPPWYVTVPALILAGLFLRRD